MTDELATCMTEIKKIIQSGALITGPLLAGAVLALPLPADLSQPALAVAAVALWMALWWMTETVSLAVTALLPLVLFPTLGIASIETTATAYAHPLIFLFLGGFLMARSMQRWGLSRRIALSTMRLSADRPTGIIAGIMAATAFLRGHFRAFLDITLKSAG